MPDHFRTDDLDWEDLRFAAALGEARSLAGAARRLGVTHSTVGRRLAALEQQMGIELFEQRVQGWVPTPAGRDVLAIAATIAEQVASLHRRLTAGADGLTGTVRVTATDGVIHDLAGPVLAQLACAHPGLTFELLADDRRLSLARREADIALRWSRPEEGDLIARRLVTLEHALCILPQAPPNLPLATFDDSLAQTPESHWLALHYPDHPVVLRSNRLSVIEQAIRAGAAMGLLPRHRQQGLRVLALPHPLPTRELWLAIHRDLAAVPRMRLVREALSAAAERMNRGISLVPAPRFTDTDA